MNFTKVFLIVLTVLGLAACGGSDDPAEQSKEFSISLISINVKRVSNAEAVDIDTSGVSSGTLTYTP